MVNGIAQKPIEGVSMAYTWDKANANAPSTRTTQYFEMFGNRGIYHDGWYRLHDAAGRRRGCWARPSCPDVVNGYKWELYDLTEDYSQANDLAAQEARQAAGDAGAVPGGGGEVQVFPLDNSRPAARC